MAGELENLKELALALRAQRNALARRAADLRRERGKTGDATANDGYLQGSEFLPFQEQLDAVERAIADEERRAADAPSEPLEWPEGRAPIVVA